MNMKTIRHLAKSLKVEMDQLSKADPIREIQLAEGNFDCYGSASSGDCGQRDCVWRDDCLSESVAASAPVQ